jgi:hypothetical protein
MESGETSVGDHREILFKDAVVEWAAFACQGEFEVGSVRMRPLGARANMLSYQLLSLIALGQLRDSSPGIIGIGA